LGITLLAAILLTAWPLERLFTRPFAWGTRPDKLTWSKQGDTLAFVWNAEGGRFLDLYAYDAAAGKLRRVTNLESLSDPLTHSPAEKDDRQKLYVAPPEGISEFDASRDGARVAFAFRGDLWLADTAASAPPLRLTRSRAAESAPQFSPYGAKLAFISTASSTPMTFEPASSGR
jgi:Tol biopolymer transport system component